jgi:hypothetical protein
VDGTDPYVAHNQFTGNRMIRLVWEAQPHFYNNTISSSDQVGISAHGSYPKVEKTTFVDNPTAIQLESESTMDLINSTISGGDTHMDLDDDSHLVSLNSTFDNSKVVFDDDLSTLTIKWFLHVYVRDNVGDPVAGAVVNVENATNEVIHTQLTGLDGYVRWIVCTERVMDKSGSLMYTPHNASASKDTLTGYADPEPTMDISKRVEIVLNLNLPPPPPTGLRIEVIGSDIRLSWQAPDTIDLSHYHIFRAGSPFGFDFTIPWVDTSVDVDPIDFQVNPLRLSWNHTGSATNPNNYFYVVRAVDGSGQNDSNTFTVGKFVIPLVKGWNMVSVPLIQVDTSLNSVLSSISGFYNIVQHYNAFHGQWHSTSDDLTHVDRTMALWIHMKQAKNLVLVGEVPTSTSIELTVANGGWNFIGYPSFYEKPVADVLLSNTGFYDAVQVYYGHDTEDHWKHYEIAKPPELNDLDLMKPGYGYWVHVTQDYTLTI